MAAAAINGIGLEYEISGAGPPVLFLNGLCARAAHWAYQRQALEPRYRVVTFDNRDIGRSDAPAEPGYGIPQMADDAAALLDHLGIERAHVVGPSMGSLVAQEMALRHPDRVRSLTLACSWTHADPRLLCIYEGWAAIAHRMPLEEWYRWFFLPSVVSPAFLADRKRVDWLVERLFSSPSRLESETIERQVRGMMEWSGTREGQLGGITQPALVLAGADDTLTPPHLARALARALPNARFKQLPGGHGFIAEHSERFNEALLGFLDWLGAASA